MNGSTERSEKLLKKVVDRLQSEEARSLQVDMEGGVPTFTYFYEDDPGIVRVDLFPEEKLIPWATEESRRILDRVFLAYNSQVEKEGSGGRKLEGLSDDDEENEHHDQVVVVLACAFVQTMQGKLQMALGELMQEVSFLVEGLCRSSLSQVAELNGKLTKMPDIKEEVEKFAKDLVAERKAFLKGSLSQFSPKRVWRENLRETYRRLLPLWQDAKNFYEQNSHRPAWKLLVKGAITDEVLPDDLIGRLSGKLNDVPSEMQAKWSEKGGQDKPSDLALEHAARLCGKAPYELTIRRLYQVIEDKSGDGEIEADETLH
jgi:hypothetical protein